MNEGGCDPDGRFYCGSMAYDQTPGAGALYRLDPDGAVQRGAHGRDGLQRPGVEPRRLARLLQRHPDPPRSPSSTTTATPGCTGGGPSSRSRTTRLPGRPHRRRRGRRLDRAVRRRRVRRYRPDGELDGVVEVPAPKVTACTFGGERLDQLFVTTSRENNAPEAAAGSVFRAARRGRRAAGARVRRLIGRDVAARSGTLASHASRRPPITIGSTGLCRQGGRDDPGHAQTHSPRTATTQESRHDGAAAVHRADHRQHHRRRHLQPAVLAGVLRPDQPGRDGASRRSAPSRWPSCSP